ncbi:hypothetical protein HanIR_Chr13g0658521 [Helianthus annuus]|nr:hypothetical protein HanIR_Chr13g0658521 [Helianthus annuus]
MPIECALHHYRFVFSSRINEIITFTGVLSIETDFKLELKQPLRFQTHPLITRQLDAFVGGEGSFWVNNVVFDEWWLGFRWLQMKLAVMVRH